MLEGAEDPGYRFGFSRCIRHPGVLQKSVQGVENRRVGPWAARQRARNDMKHKELSIARPAEAG